MNIIILQLICKLDLESFESDIIIIIIVNINTYIDSYLSGKNKIQTYFELCMQYINSYNNVLYLAQKNND